FPDNGSCSGTGIGYGRAAGFERFWLARRVAHADVFSSAGSFFMAAPVAKSTTCKFEYLALLTYSGYLAFAACLAGHIVSWDQLTGLLRDYWLASGDPHQSRL